MPVTMDWQPDFRQLRAFVAVAEEGSFTLAAQRIAVTQSAVSHSIRSLEGQLGSKLLDRSHRRVRPTPEGKVFLQRCRRVLSELEQVGRDLDGLRKWGQGQIRVGASQAICQSLMPVVLREFRDCCPRCEPVIEAGNTERLLERLHHAELDLVIAPRRADLYPNAYRPMFSDRLSFVASPAHPVIADQDGAADPKSMMLIYARSSATERVIRPWLARQNGSASKPLVLGDMQSVKEMAKLGIGIGVIAPWVATRELAEGSLREVEIGVPSIAREWGVYLHPERRPSQIEETFIGLCEVAIATMPTGRAEALT